MTYDNFILLPYYYEPNRSNRIKSKQRIVLKGEIEGTDSDEDNVWKIEGKEVTHSYGNPITWNTQRRRRGRVIVYCRAVPYPIRYCALAIFMVNQQLQQQQYSREKRETLWYYYHAYGSHRKIHYSSHPSYNKL